MLKELYLSVVNTNGESEKLLQMIGQCAHSEARILDVGCGYGRNLDRLLGAGFRNITGVEINPGIVAANRARNLDCLTVEEFSNTSEKYDIILMSHVIEHFAPSNLKEFLDDYLDRLNVGGYLVIATPLMSDYFYDDFDHVKPYQPVGILMVFGTSKAQVQYYSRNKLILKDIWFRKEYLRISFSRGIYLKTATTRLIQMVTFVSALVFLLSGRLIGKKNGWIGVFQKVSRDGSGA